MAKAQEATNYDYQPEVGSGRYLSLKKKGDAVTIRIVSTPVYVFEGWTKTNKGWDVGPFEEMVEKYGEDKVTKREKFAWKVIDRADGKVKMFQATKMVYIDIKNLNTDENWGDPQKYDVKVTRTEEQNNYYDVMPIPKGMGDITEEEKKAVEESKIDLKKEMENSLSTRTFGDDNDSTDTVEEAVPEDTKDEEIDLEDEDIPF